MLSGSSLHGGKEKCARWQSKPSTTAATTEVGTERGVHDSAQAKLGYTLYFLMSSVVWEPLRASLRLASGLLPLLLPWLHGVQTRRPADEDEEAESAPAVLAPCFQKSVC